MNGGARGLLLALALAASSTAAYAESLELRVIDEQGQTLDSAHTRASLSRTLPPELGSVPGPDHDALSFLWSAPPDTSLLPLGVLTLGVDGRPLDANVNFPTEPATCPDGVAPELVCRRSLPLRLVALDLDRAHPATKQRSLLAALGGVVRVSLGGRTLLELPVGGPRAARGDWGDLQARLRVLILRTRRGGAPAVGGTDAAAKQLLQTELAAASAIWAQCGVSLGATSIEVVDPPSSQLASVGCGLGQAASGGWLRLQRGARRVALQTYAGESPTSVALRLAGALSDGGKLPEVFENQRDAADASPSADLWLGPRGNWRPVSGQP
ncbi:MAG TPA: hypothetical protein VEQ58_11845, partial [Polyangiaceae bacterium]|nr:hypothetical protein [Polyangiaceae bacterium]